jgi:isoquinoline 1-oxidoreductase subunit beta
VTSRRTFVIGGATTAGALVVGYALWPSRRLLHETLLAAGRGERFVSNWIKIADDDSVTVVIPHCDMGTGIYTALAQMAAEELDADWASVRVETAPADRLFANAAMAEGFANDAVPRFLRGPMDLLSPAIAEHMNLQTTGGSSAVRMTGVYGMCVAGAAARELLVKAAADRMHAHVESFRTETGRVIHTPSGRSFRFGELAAAAAHYHPSGNPRLKARTAYTLVGRPVKRLDIPEKVNGVARYGMDMQLPGMLYGALHIAPVFGSTLVSVDDAAVAARPGIKKIVRLDDAVVVLADRFWRARDAAQALAPVFNDGGNGNVTSAMIHDRHLAALPVPLPLPTPTDHGITIERVYNVPYLAHAAMEPVNATARYDTTGTLEVWAGTQDGLGARAYCAQVANIGMDKVTFHLLPSGGAFGRRLPGAWNFLAYAVRAAIAVPGVPVKVIFTREQDVQHEYYRPNVTSRFRATVNAEGAPVMWVNDYTTDDSAADEAHIIYAVPNQTYRAAKVTTHVPVGSWRSVESSWHGFFIESFIDELAHEARRDPIEYRRALLKDKPRHRAVLDRAAEQSGWGTPLPKGYARGVAIVESFGTVVAEVATIEVTSAGGVTVHHVTAVADCGMVVNPDGFAAQIEGGIIFGLSAALSGEITIDHGAVVQGNFPDYPVVKLANCPAIDVVIHESDGPLGGAGEPGVPPIAPAVTNAVFAATGVRIRDLPIAKHPLV